VAVGTGVGVETGVLVGVVLGLGVGLGSSETSEVTAFATDTADATPILSRDALQADKSINKNKPNKASLRIPIPHIQRFRAPLCILYIWVL
jgi:hypothetical protein